MQGLRTHWVYAIDQAAKHSEEYYMYRPIIGTRLIGHQALFCISYTCALGK